MEISVHYTEKFMEKYISKTGVFKVYSNVRKGIIRFLTSGKCPKKKKKMDLIKLNSKGIVINLKNKRGVMLYSCHEQV